MLTVGQGQLCTAPEAVLWIQEGVRPTFLQLCLLTLSLSVTMSLSLWLVILKEPHFLPADPDHFRVHCQRVSASYTPTFSTLSGSVSYLRLHPACPDSICSFRCSHWVLDFSQIGSLSFQTVFTVSGGGVHSDSQREAHEPQGQTWMRHLHPPSHTWITFHLCSVSLTYGTPLAGDSRSKAALVRYG